MDEIYNKYETGGTGPRPHELVELVKDVLTPDLLIPKWRKAAEASGNPFTGHCYAASEALFHMFGGSQAGWLPCILRHADWPTGLKPSETHWFLKNKATGETVDPTAGQFRPLCVPHDLGRGCGFLTGEPSKRAAVIMARVAARLTDVAPCGELETGSMSFSM